MADDLNLNVGVKIGGDVDASALEKSMQEAIGKALAVGMSALKDPKGQSARALNSFYNAVGVNYNNFPSMVKQWSASAKQPQAVKFAPLTGYQVNKDLNIASAESYYESAKKAISSLDPLKAPAPVQAAYEVMSKKFSTMGLHLGKSGFKTKWSEAGESSFYKAFETLEKYYAETDKTGRHLKSLSTVGINAPASFQLAQQHLLGQEKFKQWSLDETRHGYTKSSDTIEAHNLKRATILKKQGISEEEALRLEEQVKAEYVQQKEALKKVTDKVKQRAAGTIVPPKVPPTAVGGIPGGAAEEPSKGMPAGMYLTMASQYLGQMKALMFGGMISSLGTGLSSVFTNLGSLIFPKWASGLQQSLVSGVSGAAASILGIFGPAFAALGPVIGATLGAAFLVVGGALRVAFAPLFIVIDQIRDGLKVAFKDGGAYVEELTKAATPLAIKFGDAQLQMSKLHQEIVGAAGEALIMPTQAAQLLTAYTKVTKSVTNFKDMLVQVGRITELTGDSAKVVGDLLAEWAVAFKVDLVKDGSAMANEMKIILATTKATAAEFSSMSGWLVPIFAQGLQSGKDKARDMAAFMGAVAQMGSHAALQLRAMGTALESFKKPTGAMLSLLLRTNTKLYDGNEAYYSSLSRTSPVLKQMYRERDDLLRQQAQEPENAAEYSFALDTINKQIQDQEKSLESTHEYYEIGRAHV